jgi:hypothetical protein
MGASKRLFAIKMTSNMDLVRASLRRTVRGCWNASFIMGKGMGVGCGGIGMGGLRLGAGILMGPNRASGSFFIRMGRRRVRALL